LTEGGDVRINPLTPQGRHVEDFVDLFVLLFI